MKKRVAIYPGFGTATHEPLHLRLISFLDAKAYTYKSIENFTVHSRKEKAIVFAIALSGFLRLLFKRNDRNLIRHKGVIISHSVIELSVRKHPIGKFEFASLKTFKLIKEAVNYVRCCLNCIHQNETVLILGGDEAYIHGSILGQIANLYDIPNLYIKQSSDFLAAFPYDSNTLFAGPNFKLFPDFYLTNGIEQAVVENYENDLKNAVSGNANYFYMRNQGVPVSELTEKEIYFLKDALVLYLHDFIDSPGVYGKCVFFDQWEWLDQVVAIVKKHNTKLVIKLHPNMSESNRPAVNILKKKLHSNSNIMFIETKVALTALKQANIKGILTLFGSVIVEAAYLGIICISASNNPYVGFALSHNASSKKDFDAKLSALCSGKLTTDFDQFKPKAIEAYAVSRIYYSRNYVIRGLPYDDVNKQVFQELFPEIENSFNYGINERRSVFLRSDRAKKYVIDKITSEEAELKDRFYQLIDHLP